MLEEMGAAQIPRITIWNKMDCVGDPGMVRSVAAGRDAVVCCSAATGEGIPELLQALEHHLGKRMVLRRALIPFSQARSRCPPVMTVTCACRGACGMAGECPSVGVGL